MDSEKGTVKPASVMNVVRRYAWRASPLPRGMNSIPRMYDIAIARLGDPFTEVWMTEQNGRVWVMNARGYEITHIRSGHRRLAVSPDRLTVWAVTLDGQLWKGKGGTWLQAQTTGKLTSPIEDVTVDTDNTAWVTGQDGTIWVTRDGTSFDERTTIFPFKRLAAGPVMWAIGSNGTLWKRNTETMAWSSSSGMTMVEDISISSDGVVWITDQEGRVWTSSDGETFKPNSGEGFRNISAGQYGVAWGIKTDGTLWYWAEELETGPDTSGSGGSGSTGQAPPPATPTISCSVTRAKDSDPLFKITGSGFMPNQPVRVRVTRIVNERLHDVSLNTLSDADGKIFLEQPIPCVAGPPLNFSATDGRVNLNDLTGVLWSNTVPCSCPS